jgi:hypothetical protein
MLEDVNELAAQWAAAIAFAERPAPFSSRDGSILRLVPVNDRLAAKEMQQHLCQLMQQDPAMLAEFKAQLPFISMNSSRPHTKGSCHAAVLMSHTCTRCGVMVNGQTSTVKHIPISVSVALHSVPAAVPRHLAAWARGCCYLQAGNGRQALKDAQTAMAYAAAAAAADVATSACTAGLATAAIQPAATTSQPYNGSSSSSSSTFLQQQPAPPPTAAVAATGAKVAAPTCRWIPALLLAAEAFAALAQWPQAVIHCAAAALQAPGDAAVADRLASLVRQLIPEQAVAFRTGGLPALLQQLQLEAEMRLPEVLRPRPKW